MYVIREKKSKEIRFIEYQDLEKKAKAKEIYPDFNIKTMEFGYTNQGYLPAHFHIDKKGNIREWTLEEKVNSGLSEIGKHQKIENGEVVDKTSEELIKENVITIEELKERRISYFSDLSFQLRFEILPDYKLENAALGVYDEQKTANYRATVLEFKKEFSRLRDLVEKAKKVSDIEKVTASYPTEIIQVKL